MEEKRGSGRGSKRQAKVADDGYWDCSVCTYKNSPEAYKCEMCDVRKGTSTRKPRINPQLAQQVEQQFAPPPTKKERLPSDRKKEKQQSERTEQENGRTGTTIKQFTQSQLLKRVRRNKQESIVKRRQLCGSSPRLRNIDRSKGKQFKVTCNNVTVVITDYPIETVPDVRSSDSHISSDASDTNSSAPSHDLHTDNSAGSTSTSGVNT